METSPFKNRIAIITLRKPDITNFAEERNKLLKMAKAEWVFFVDSDEVVTPELKREILQAIKCEEFNGFWVTRRDFIFGKELKHGEFSGYGWFGNASLLRLARKSAGEWKRSVHEYWDIKGKLGFLRNPLFHYPHQTLREFIGNINFHSGLHAKALRDEGKKSGLWKIVVWPSGKFIYNYVFRLGFLDGMAGFVVALMMSFHSFLSWTKQWELQRD